MGKNILLAVDGGETSSAAVRKALSMAKEGSGRITAVFVKDIGFRMKPSFYSLREIDAMARIVFSDLVSQAEEEGVEIEFKLAIGHVARDIASLSRGYDFVVCGSHGRGTIGRALFGSVSDSLARTSKCATMIVHA